MGISQRSGATWTSRYPTSTRISDLNPAFGASVTRFTSALRTAGAHVNISATLRPSERAYLMHYAWRIAREGLDPATVPAMNGVAIDWVHRDAQGNIDLARSRAAAAEMVAGYGIVFRPGLSSNHTQGRAIDMTITNYVGRTVSDATGQRIVLRSAQDRHRVGASYGVRKLASDPPHWSDDGH